MIKRFDIKIKLFQIAKFSRQNVVLLKTKHTLRFDGKKPTLKSCLFLGYIVPFLGHCSSFSSMKYCEECLKPRMKLATTRASVRFESRPALTICRTVSEVS